MIRFILLLTCLIVATDRGRTQTLQVYPGDINNNGIVNNIDFLYMGLAYNYAGPARTPESTVFAPQTAQPWQWHFANNLNFAYADCNGDGIVNYYYDAFPIYVNYGLTHDSVKADVFPPGTPGIDPRLRLDGTGIGPVHKGQVVEVPLVLGDAEHPIEDLYGLAFSFHADSGVVNAGQVHVDMQEISWANPDNDRVYMYKAVSGSRVDAGWVRTDHNMQNGYGRIGKIQLVIVIDVIALKPLPIHVDSIKMIDKFGNETAVAGDTLTLMVYPEALSSGNEPSDAHVFKVQPNPASDVLELTHDAVIYQVTLTDALGRPVIRQSADKSSTRMALPILPSGLYLLEARTEHGVYIRKIWIQS